MEKIIENAHILIVFANKGTSFLSIIIMSKGNKPTERTANMKYSNITTMEQFKEFLKDVDSAGAWNGFETEEWESACDFAGLNYHDYDDPDVLFADLQKFAENN